VNQLFAIGKMARVTAEAARAAGLQAVIEHPDAESAAADVKRYLRTGDLILVKASRAARLERLIEALRPPDPTLMN
jgi:UDP-N-acetylmuramoyl-tripeptide--D-alanyl-D-alanine ligase